MSPLCLNLRRVCIAQAFLRKYGSSTRVSPDSHSQAGIRHFYGLCCLHSHVDRRLRLKLDGQRPFVWCFEKEPRHD